MSDIRYDVFARWLRRCKEIAEEPEMTDAVVGVYNDVLKPYAETYLPLDTAVLKAMSAWAKENGEAIDAIERLDEPFRTAREVALANVPTLELPDTLKAQTTDTDIVAAIETTIDVIDDHAGTPWADRILAGRLGTEGPEVVREITESAAANKGLSGAKEKRAAAYGPTHDRFLRFKRVLRSSLGPSSKQYRRIHGRAAEKPEPNEGGPTGGPTT